MANFSPDRSVSQPTLPETRIEVDMFSEEYLHQKRDELKSMLKNCKTKSDLPGIQAQIDTEYARIDARCGGKEKPKERGRLLGAAYLVTTLRNLSDTYWK